MLFRSVEPEASAFTTASNDGANARSDAPQSDAQELAEGLNRIAARLQLLEQRLGAS